MAAEQQQQQQQHMKVYTRDDLGPNDVLLGRGRPIQTWAGNVRFRSMVAARKVEYDAASKNSDKGRIALELIRQIAEGGNASAAATADDAPGRFLRPLTKDEVESLGEEHDEGCKFAELWTDADEKKILEKIKQLLRQYRILDKASAADKKDDDEEEDDERKTRRQLAETTPKRAETKTNTATNSSSPTLAPISAVGGGHMYLDPVADFGPIKLNGKASGLDVTLGAEAATMLGEQEINGGLMEHTTLELGNARMLARLLNDLDMSENILVTGPTIAPCPVPESPPPAEVLVETDQTNSRNFPATSNSATDASIDNEASVVSNNNNDRSLPLKMKIAAALGAARTLAEAHKAATYHDENKIQNDLKSLGLVLFQLFTGVTAPADTSIDVAQDEKININDQPERQCKRIEGGSSVSNPFDILRDAGLPLSLCTLVLSLLDATNPSAAERYISSADVEEDLLRMTSSPNRYLSDPPLQNRACVLDFSGNRLYGRYQQWNRMKTFFDSIIVKGEKRCGLALVTGPAGSGKTYFVKKLRAPLAEQRGMFISVKFDSQGSEQPISKIFRAVEEYCQMLLQGDPILLAEIGLAVKEALGTEGVVLKDLIPSLGTIVGGWGSTHFDIEQKETYNLILHYFRRLVRAISGPTHPVIWLLDDLQWSDMASLEIITKLVTDEEMQSMLFIGCFRADEVAEDHPLNRSLRDTMMISSPCETILLGNLDKESVNALLSDVLHLSPRLTRPLAGLLYTRTRGNPMFVKQLLKSLCDAGLLQYSARSRRWIWDIDSISAKSVADNTVDLIVDMMKSYGTEIRSLLRTASCLGSTFDAATIKLLYSGQSLFSSRRGDGSEVVRHLATVASDGLTLKKGSTYRFSHDQIWQAAYELTPPLERQAMHACIGRQLLYTAPEDDLDTFIFTIVDQLNRGVDIINHHTEQLQLAQLNLKAGEKALAATSFLQASIYLLQGSVLIADEDWQSHYDLCLRLFTNCAEVQLALGNDDAAIQLVNQILTNGSCKRLDDKIRAHQIFILANIAQWNFLGSIQHAVCVLEQLGESFPDTANQSIVKNELDSTQAMLKSTSIEDILSKPTTNDARKTDVMRILILASRASYATNPNLMLSFVLRMVKIAMVDGLTPEASYAFAALSFALCSLGNHEMAAYCAEVAKQLLTKYDRKYSIIVITLLNASILPYRQPIQACLNLFRQTYKDACSVGDQEWARTSGNQIAQIGLFAPERGNGLDDVENEIMLLEEAKKKESNHAHMYLQVALNLKSVDGGDNHDDPAVLTGEAFDQDEYIAIAKANQLRQNFRKIYFCEMYLAYLFRRYDTAAGKFDIMREVASSARFSSTVDRILETFYGGLVAAAMLSRQPIVSNEDTCKWQMLAKESLEQLRRWAKDGSEWNFRHKYDLLRAEIAAADGHMDTAATAYDDAICGASEHCFINEKGLACERAGMFYLEQGIVNKGKEYLMKAAKLYSDWGARRKAADVTYLLQQRCYTSC